MIKKISKETYFSLRPTDRLCGYPFIKLACKYILKVQMNDLLAVVIPPEYV